MKKWQIASVTVLAVVIAVHVARSAFVHVPLWDAVFEDEPEDTDSVGDGALEIRTLKEGVRERMDFQHQFGSVGGGGPDTGWHREGSAWALTSADCSAEAIDADHEPGRICIETVDYSMWILNDAMTAYVRVNAAPQNAIILWDQATGDENCDGTPGAGECPCGYSEATEFRGIMARGADAAAADPWIPDDPGESCVGDGSGNDPPCVTATGRYDDQIAVAQMPEHNHEIILPINSDSTLWPVQFAADLLGPQDPPAWTEDTGGDEQHYHPFRTVLFCRKD